MSDRKRGRALIDSDSDDSDGSANLDEVNEFFFWDKKIWFHHHLHISESLLFPPPPPTDNSS